MCYKDASWRWALSSQSGMFAKVIMELVNICFCMLDSSSHIISSCDSIYWRWAFLHSVWIIDLVPGKLCSFLIFLFSLIFIVLSAIKISHIWRLFFLRSMPHRKRHPSSLGWSLLIAGGLLWTNGMVDAHSMSTSCTHMWVQRYSVSMYLYPPLRVSSFICSQFVLPWWHSICRCHNQMLIGCHPRQVCVHLWCPPLGSQHNMSPQATATLIPGFFHHRHDDGKATTLTMTYKGVKPVNRLW